LRGAPLAGCVRGGRARPQVDLVSKRCEVAGCDTISSFGYPGELRRRCKAHMLDDGMVCARRGTRGSRAALTGKPDSWPGAAGGFCCRPWLRRGLCAQVCLSRAVVTAAG